ncbi:hypothetical protein ACWCYZ_24985 [Streptomyces virginiae]
MSHARREALKAKGQRKADAWNAKYPVGTPVTAYPGVRPEDPAAPSMCTTLTTKTRSVAWPLGHGDVVVMVEGYSGGICLTHIDVITGGAR